MKPSGISFVWLVLLSLIWGSSFILMKRGLLAFSPFQIAAIRMVLAGLCLFPVVIQYLRKSGFSRSEWIALVCSGLLGNALPAWLFPLAETQLNSATVGVLNALTPLSVIIVGVSFFRMSSQLLQWIGVMIGLIGAILLVVLSKQEVSLQVQAEYSLLVLGAAVCYGISANVIKRYLGQIPAPVISACSLGIGSIPYLWVLWRFPLAPVFEQDPGAWGAFAYLAVLAIVGTAIALIIFNHLVKAEGPVFATSVTYLIPIVALLWGLIDNEPISWGQMGSIVLILGGVYLANR